MTPEQIIEMAKQAGFNRLKYVHPKTGVHYSEAYAPDSLQRFAQLVRNEVLNEAYEECLGVSGDFETAHECRNRIQGMKS